jgi:muramoyltetrapeptide carboxypeptidase
MLVLGAEAQERRLPRALQPGDGVALVAPARFAMPELIEDAASQVSAAGFRPVIPPGLDARENQFGGSDLHRANVLNGCFRDPAVRAVWALRGGYGSARLLPLLDSAAFQSDPKWIVGFSDITALHAWADRLGIASLHAPVASTSSAQAGTSSLWHTLFQPSPASPASPPVVGGNLSVLYSLLGTPYFPDVRGCVLLLEDLDEYLYHIDRMLVAFRLAGVWDTIAGLAVGDFTELRDNTRAFGQAVDNAFGRDLREMIRDAVPAELPILWDLPVGHGPINRPVVLGHSGWIVPKFAEI